MKLGRWLTNIYDYRKPEYARIALASEGSIEAQQRYQEWVKSKIIGPPKASEKYTREEMEARGLIGLYEPAEPTSATT